MEFKQPFERYRAKEPLTYDAVAIDEREKAIRVEVDGKRAWLPKSQIDDDSEVYKGGHRGKLVIPYWLAHEKGFTIPD